MMNMPQIDWNEVWQTRNNEQAEAKYANSKFWDKRAPEFTVAVTGSDYIEQFVDMLQPEPTWTVLDIGSAAGTLAAPLAKRVRSVTAVDPSLRMRELLQERCVREELDNIRVLEGSWQDKWEDLGIEPHDVVIGSRSLVVSDLRGALLKAHAFATRKVVVSALVGDGPHDRRIVEAAGKTFDQGMDYIVIVNLLRQMGIFANVAFTYNIPRSLFSSVDDAFHEVRWMVHDMTDEEEQGLRDYLAAMLLPVENGLYMPDVRPVRWAVISWDKTTGCDADHAER